LGWAIFEIPEKKSHSRRKYRFRFGSALKLAVFGFSFKTITALFVTVLYQSNIISAIIKAHTVVASLLKER